MFRRILNRKGDAVEGASILLCLAILLVFLGGNLFLAAGVSEGVAIKAMEDMGFTNVSVESKHIFFVSCQGGSKSDDVVFVCRGTNPAGKQVKMKVFAGAGMCARKSATVRSD